MGQRLDVSGEKRQDLHLQSSPAEAEASGFTSAGFQSPLKSDPHLFPTVLVEKGVQSSQTSSVSY